MNALEKAMNAHSRRMDGHKRCRLIADYLLKMEELYAFADRAEDVVDFRGLDTI
jgi:dGTP triphosphohydrolase